MRGRADTGTVVQRAQRAQNLDGITLEALLIAAAVSLVLAQPK